MMTTENPIYLPVLERNEFPVLRRLMDAQFQATYRTWMDWVSQHAKWAESSQGIQAIPVRVRIRDFANPERLRNPPGLVDLLHYAERMSEHVAA